MTTPEVVQTWGADLVDIDSVQPHPANFRDHDVGAIAASIARWGVWRAIVVQRSTGYILVGNGEWKALQSLHARKVPVRYVDVDDVNAEAILLADNWIPRRGRDDTAAMLQIMVDVHDDEDLMNAIGIDDDDLNDLTRRLDAEDEPLSVSEPRSRKSREPITCPSCGHRWTPGGKA